jgi:hypothetical protein
MQRALDVGVQLAGNETSKLHLTQAHLKYFRCVVDCMINAVRQHFGKQGGYIRTGEL